LAAGDGILLYDVRTSEEYESGHIPGAVNIPHSDIAAQLPVSKKNDIIVVYCAGGVRSYAAYQWLSSKGFNCVVDFGALWNWEGELVKGPDPYISK
jgi:phage shock protein E